MTKFEDLNDGGRLALCDIAWFIKGYRAAKPDSSLEEDHEETLKRVINVLGDKVRSDKRKADEQKADSNVLTPNL